MTVSAIWGTVPWPDRPLATRLATSWRGHLKRPKAGHRPLVHPVHKGRLDVVEDRVHGRQRADRSGPTEAYGPGFGPRAAVPTPSRGEPASPGGRASRPQRSV